ncbi:signal peptide peptidase SppA [Parvibaculum indicum]|uniref:S49 family peptidase n=1 Tax=Parvibaculum indicum TaxID=562969 RepID=UPI00141F17F2|nr:S49 family peptidase [Parvibaculum indicum]NIJ40350.1 signal peptide peptidase SppA [Parvibaculum indicum]
MIDRGDLLAQLACEPMLIDKPYGLSFLASMAALPEKLDWGNEDEEVDRSRCYPVVNGVAIIPLIGTLYHRPFRTYWGGSRSNYMSYVDMLEDAVTDENIRAVLAEVDSYGGLAAGCLDAAEAIREMRGIKPMWASINQVSCSAGYSLTSSFDHVTIGKSAKAGSIGVMAVHWDYSKALEKWGEKVTYFYAGAHKIDGVPFAELTEQAKKAIQDSIQAEYERMCEVIAAGRGMDAKKIMATEAAVYRGKDAVDAGLADEVATFEETLAMITRKTAPDGARLGSAANPGPGEEGDEDMSATETKTQDRPNSGQPAPTAAAPTTASPAPTPAPTATTAAPVEADAAAIAEACHAAGHPELTSSLIKAKPTMEQVTARIDEVKEIVTAAQGVGLEGMAKDLIQSGVSLESARTLLFSAKAGADGQVTTDTAHTSMHAPAKPGIDVKAAYASFNGVKG